MDKPEKIKLNKEKTLADCINYLNIALEAFECLKQYEAKESNHRENYSINSLDNWKKRNEEMQRLLDSNQEKIDTMLAQMTPQEPKLVNRIKQIELNVLNLKWGVFLLLLLQTAILIELLI